MESNILRIYRSERNISHRLVGLVEEVGVEGKKRFTNLGQLWNILDVKTGETVQAEKRKKAKKEERRMHHEGINLDRQPGIGCKR